MDIKLSKKVWGVVSSIKGLGRGAIWINFEVVIW